MILVCLAHLLLVSALAQGEPMENQLKALDPRMCCAGQLAQPFCSLHGSKGARIIAFSHVEQEQWR